MNSLQRGGATVSYLQRYTMKAALGVAATKDTDGAGSKEEEYDTSVWSQKIIDAEGDVDALKKVQASLKAERGKIPEGALKTLSAAWSAAMARAVKQNGGGANA